MPVASRRARARLACRWHLGARELAQDRAVPGFRLGRLYPLHVGNGHADRELDMGGRARVDDRDLAIATQETCDVARRTHRCGQADALRLTDGELRQSFEREREMAASFRRRERVDLVDDHGLDLAQVGSRLRAEDQEERLGCRHENVSRISKLLASLFGRGVTGAHVHADVSERLVMALGLARDADERGAQVALDVVDERLEGRDIKDAGSRFCVLGKAHQLVDGP